MSELKDAFVDRLHMSQNKAAETLKNAALTSKLAKILREVTNMHTIDQKYAKLIIFWCSNVKQQIWEDSIVLLEHILTDKIQTSTQVEYALDYLMNVVGKNNFDENEFNKYSGVGVVISSEEISECVSKVIEEMADKLVRGLIINKVHKTLKFADRMQIMTEADKQIKARGPMPDKKEIKKAAQNFTYETLFEDTSKFHRVGENFKTDRYQITPNTMKNIESHLKRTGAKVMTRFPPEPSGILHIGHVKAIILDFGYAKYKSGHTYLRMDDTNPVTEEQRFIDEIINSVKWLGYKPFKITHSSDYFDQLYEFAVQMIKLGLAYVCHMTKDELRDRSLTASPWRNRSIEENLLVFDQMRQGMFDEGSATLRLKYTMEDGKFDPVAYRINYAAHPRTGKKWCIYPSYDFSHPIVDSLEDITHSMCSKEFTSHRSFYYWLCNKLDIYCPVQWEFARLNLTNTITSKRKIWKAIENGIVSDWDDPRLYTISAMKRRGIPRSSLYKFCETNSVTLADSFISPKKLEAFARADLNETAPRAVAILQPIKVNIKNFSEFTKSGLTCEYSFSDFPDKPNKGKSYKLKLDSSIYIDAKDCDLNCGDENYKRLKPGQKVGLMGTRLQIELFMDKISPVARTTNEIIVKISPIENEAPKVYIHWLTNPLIAEIRLFKNLFKHEFPEKPEYGGFLNDANLDSLDVYENAFIERRMASSNVGDTFQFVREGYFCVDKDSTACKLVFNRTVELKDTWSSKSTNAENVKKK